MIVGASFLLVIATSSAFLTSTKWVRNKVTIRSSKALLNAPIDSVKVEDGIIPEYSFVNKDMRAYAMKLHTPQQAPKEGKAKGPEVFESKEKANEALKTAQAASPETPMIVWQPEKINYVQFLVDSLEVYETLERLSEEYDVLAPFRSTGLERAAALREDLDFLSKTYSIKVPGPGPHGPGYAAHLRDLAATNMPKFICHYYNHMFAHTAGGRMIGKRMADMLLDGTTLKFYQWEGDVKELGKATVKKIDELAATWTAEEKQTCLEETGMSFRYSGALMVYLRPPAAELNNIISYV